MENQTGQPVGLVEWETSHTFLADLYSGDLDRMNAAFQRFIDGLLPSILAQIRKALPAHQQSLAEDVTHNLLVRLLKRLEKGWRHSPGTRFRECMMRMAKDAISETRRRLRRRQEVELDEAIIGQVLTDIADGFCRTEVLQAAESRVQAVTRPDHWLIYVKWKARKGYIADSDSQESTSDREQDGPLTDSERKIVERIRKAIGEEIERIAERGGFEPGELFLDGS